MAEDPVTAPSFERAFEFSALIRAARRAAKGKRRSADTARWLAELESEALRLEDALHSGRWRPGPRTTFHIHDPKPRLISAAPFRDRVVHHALCAEIEPALEAYAFHGSFACRRGKGLARAMDRAQHLARRHPYALRMDIRRFFFSVDHDVLLEGLGRVVEDARLRAVMAHIVRVKLPGCAEGKGLPIGHLTSQHFANFYLGALDHFLEEQPPLRGLVRYMDDYVAFADRKSDLWSFARAADDHARAALRLELKPSATRVLPVSEGVPFPSREPQRESAGPPQRQPRVSSCERTQPPDGRRSRMPALCTGRDHGSRARAGEVAAHRTKMMGLASESISGASLGRGVGRPGPAVVA